MRHLRSRHFSAPALAALLICQQGLFIAQAAAQEASAPEGARVSVPSVSVVPSLPQISVSLPLETPSVDLPNIAGPVAQPSTLTGPVAQPAATAALPAAVAAAQAQAVAKPSSLLQAAVEPLRRLFANRSAQTDTRSQQPKQSTEAAATQASTLFDGANPSIPADGSARVVLVREDGKTAHTTVSALSQTLAQDPAFAARLNSRGLVRLVLAAKDAGALKRSDVPAVKASLSAAGLSAPLDVEKLAIKEARAGKTDAPQAQTKNGSAVGRVLGAPLRELRYIGRVLVASFDKPTKSELIGGLLSKAPAFAMSAIWWSAMLWPSRPLQLAVKQIPAFVHHALTSTWTAPAHPIALAAVLAMSLALETFHGIWIQTWQNLQNIIAKQRGTTYQTIFNLTYMQSSGALFRFIAWTAIAGTIAPWTLKYWRDMGLITIVGTFIGTIGYQGLNEFYNKGGIKRWARSLMQQGRDLFFLLGGVFFASGTMGVYWPLFLTQQSLDLALYIGSRLVRSRPMAYVAEPAVAQSAEFSATYPVSGAPSKGPLREALDAVLHNPLTNVVVWTGKKIADVFRRPRK